MDAKTRARVEAEGPSSDTDGPAREAGSYCSIVTLYTRLPTVGCARMWQGRAAAADLLAEGNRGVAHASQIMEVRSTNPQPHAPTRAVQRLSRVICLGYGIANQ
jgi:hypothetical protein